MLTGVICTKRFAANGQRVAGFRAPSLRSGPGMTSLPRLHMLLLKVAALMLAFATAAAAAQDYPTRPVRVIIPFPPGGINDTMGRFIATQLSERLGKQFIVDNR